MKKLLYSSNWRIPTRFLEDTVYESFFKKKFLSCCSDVETDRRKSKGKFHLMLISHEKYEKNPTTSSSFF